MPVEEITLLLFAACNSVRVIAYVPQILKAATDKNGASSISFMTWSLFLLAHLSTSPTRSSIAPIGVWRRASRSTPSAALPFW